MNIMMFITVHDTLCIRLQQFLTSQEMDIITILIDDGIDIKILVTPVFMKSGFKAHNTVTVNH